MNRRKFITSSSLVASALMINPKLVMGSNSSTIVRIGLLGCGNRGTAVARTFINDNKYHCRVTAIADLFDDQLQNAKKLWNDIAKERGYAGISNKFIFGGLDAFQKIANCKEVDVVIISTPNYFHPQHLEAVVNSGKHCYLEKPVAIDVEGCLKIIELGKRAQGRLSLDVGFQVRSAPCFYEVVNRIHDGAIGKLASGHIFYHASELKYPNKIFRFDVSPLEKRIRRFLWDKIISGDTIVDQGIHMIDIANWAIKSHPLSATGYGNRSVRNDAGDVFDNWAISLKYPNNVQVSLSALQYGDFWDVGARFIGEQGMGESNYSGLARVVGLENWSSDSVIGQNNGFSSAGTFDGLGDADKNKIRMFLESIDNGNFHNQAYEGAISALSAILVRTAAYSGKDVEWNDLISSNLSYSGLVNLSDL